MTTEQYLKLISKLSQGTLSAEEDRSLREFLGDKPDAGYEMASQEIWNRSAGMSPGQQLRMTRDINRRIDQFESFTAANRPSRPLHPFRKRLWISVAVAAVLLCTVWAGFRLAATPGPVQEFELVCNNGQQSVLTLPDGTVVHLNSASKITYTSAYNTRNRAVTLSGEAYFDVARNEKLPFVVKAGELEIEVLGTQFDVKAYQQDEVIEATLVNGRIQATVSGQTNLLLPKERLSYNRVSGQLTRQSHLASSHLVPWLADEVCFHQNTLKEIAVLLERMYDIEVIFSDERIQSYSYSGSIRNCSLKNILELISATSPIKYTVYDNIVKFSEKQD